MLHKKRPLWAKTIHRIVDLSCALRFGSAPQPVTLELSPILGDGL